MKTRWLQTIKAAFIILLLTIAGMINVFAQDFTVDKLKYSIINSENAVRVIGHVDGYNAAGKLSIPESVTYNGVTFSVNSIGYAAFYGCSGINSLIIPISVTSIGPSAFQDCKGITTITIPNSVISIGDCAFMQCEGLASVIIPNSVTSIGYAAFRDCKELTSITIPNSVTTIKNETFKNCISLKTIIIPGSVTSIGYCAFEDCIGLFSITIDPKTKIENDAFKGCNNLKVPKKDQKTPKQINNNLEHEYIDLGLPSGTLWATCNVGADTPEGYGDYFAWGETRPKGNYLWETYKYGNWDPHKHYNAP